MTDKEKGTKSKFMERFRSKQLTNLNSLWLLFAPLGVLLGVVAALKALGTDAKLGWLITVRSPLRDTAGLEIASLMAPFVAVALGIERLIETFFDWYEQSVVAAADIVTAAGCGVTWIEQELKNAYVSVKEATGKLDQHSGVHDLAVLQRADERLSRAKEQILEWIETPQHTAWKRAISVLAGLATGILVAVLGDLGILSTAGIPVPRILDMTVTGLFIGAGPGPAHSIVGLLQGAKSAVEKVGQTVEAKAVKDALESL